VLPATDLSGAQPPWPAEAHRLWRDCVARAVYQEDLWLTPAPFGEDLLREQLGRVLGLDPAVLTITASVRAAALTYGRCDPFIALERPTFPGVVRALRDSRARVELRPWAELLTGDLPAGATIWVTTPCRNPDGASLAAAGWTALRGRLAAGHRVVVNAAYGWYATGLANAPAAPGADIIGSLHKLGGHGARLGWVCSRDYAERAVPELLGTTPPRVWQHAWGEFLRADGLILLAGQCVAPALGAAAAFRDRLASEHGRRPPSFSGPQLLLPLADGSTEQEALDQLGSQGFRLCGAEAFFADVPALRASFLGVGQEEAARFADAVVRCGLFRPLPERVAP
jgi:DNA-binding transcriptional MocR family regulator